MPEPDDSLLYGCLTNSESLCNLNNLLGDLTEAKRNELIDLVYKYPCLFGDGFNMILMLAAHTQFNSVFITCLLRNKHLDSKVKYMFDNNIAVLSSSSCASPCILVLSQIKLIGSVQT